MFVQLMTILSFKKKKIIVKGVVGKEGFNDLCSLSTET